MGYRQYHHLLLQGYVGYSIKICRPLWFTLCARTWGSKDKVLGTNNQRSQVTGQWVFSVWHLFYGRFCRGEDIGDKVLRTHKAKSRYVRLFEDCIQGLQCGLSRDLGPAHRGLHYQNKEISYMFLPSWKQLFREILSVSCLLWFRLKKMSSEGFAIINQKVAVDTSNIIKDY